MSVFESEKLSKLYIILIYIYIIYYILKSQNVEKVAPVTDWLNKSITDIALTNSAKKHFYIINKVLSPLF